MADTAALVVALSAQLTKFERDMREANTIAERGVSRINRTFEDINLAHGLEKGLNFLKGGAIGAILGEAVRKIVETLDKAGEVGEIAERIGLSTDALQVLQITAEETGGKAEDATNSMTRFADSIGDAAAGSTYLGKVLEANGVALRDQGGNIRKLDDLLVDYARLVNGAATSQEKMMLVTEAFGRRAGPQMLLTLNQIANDGLPNMIAAAKDAGSVLDEEMIKRADELSDAWKRAARNMFVAFSETVVGGIEIAKKALQGFFDLLEEIADVQLRVRSKAEGGTGTRGDELDAESAPLKVTVGGKTAIPQKGGKDPIESQIDSIKKHIAVMNASTEAVGLSAGAQERLRVEAVLTQAVLDNDKSPEAYAERIKEIGAAAEDASNRLHAKQFVFNEMISASRELGSALSDAFKGAIIQGQTFDQVLNSLVQRLESKAFDKLFDLAFAPQGASTNSLFGQLLTSLTGKAAGGPVNSGQPYVVGEKGPELFVPSQSGMIVPNKVTAQGGQVGEKTLNVSVDVSGANGDAAIEAAVNRGVQRAVQQSVSIVNTTAPGRQMRYSQLGS
jgi:hypothetical protein